MSKFKILLVDDKQRILDSYSDSLTHAGYEVVTASTEDEALEKLRLHFVHLAIVDVRLRADEDENDKSGLEFCKRIDPIIPRIVLTGYVGDWTTIRDALISKPGNGRERLADGFFYKGAQSRADRDKFYTEIKKVLSANYEFIPQRRIAVLTSGGDAPGMNAAIYAVVRSAISSGIEVVGVEDGYEGLSRNRMRKLNWNAVSEIVTESGTTLRSARYRDFMNEEVRGRAIENILSKHISGLVVVGGDGSLSGARALAEEARARGCPLQVIGIPGTIDNDIYGTDMSLGASSAANAMINQIRQIIPPAKALGMIFVIEVMGAYSGFLALESAIGTGADAVIVPEELVALNPGVDPGRAWKENVNVEQTRTNLDAQLERAALSLRNAFAAGKRYGLVIQAEGLDKCTRELIAARHGTAASGEFMSAEYTRAYLEKRFDAWMGEKAHPVRVQRLGYTVRGVLPSRFDIWLGAASGKRAVELLEEGKSDLMIKWSEAYGITEIPIGEVVDKSARAPRVVWAEREGWRRVAELQLLLARPLPDAE